MSRLCCPECFGDRELRKNIIPQLSKSRGICGYCGSHGVDLVLPIELSNLFELLISAYEIDEDGTPLVTLMKKDWHLFSHPHMDDSRCKDLLGEILDNGDIVRKRFSISSSFSSEGLLQWENLREELMYKNRYRLDQEIDSTHLTWLLSQLIADDLPKNWYRARINAGELPYSISEMGAPPKRLASHGRANPAGIPYLYVGSSPSTAVSEVRPHTGEEVCVADFEIEGKLVAVDLRNPRQTVSPFVWAEAGYIAQLRADLPFLERLGEELTRPVLPRGAAIDYVPSQYLCEVIKKSGYDGVIYRSSVSDGINLALFNPSRAIPGKVDVYNVDGVSVKISKI